MADLINQLYSFHFEKGIQMDIDSAVYLGVQSHVGEEAMQLALGVAVDPTKLNDMKRQHRIFQQVAQFCCTGLSMMLEERFEVAIENLIWAYMRDAELNDPAVKRQPEIANFLRICFCRYVVFTGKKIAAKKFDGMHAFLTNIGYMAQVPGPIDPITGFVAEELIRLSEMCPRDFGDGCKLIARILAIPQEVKGTAKDPPPPPTLQPEEELALMDRFAEVRDRVEVQCKDIIARLAELGLVPRRDHPQGGAQDRAQGDAQKDATPT